MGVETVTILVQSVIILVLGAACFWEWRFAWAQFNRAEELKSLLDRADNLVIHRIRENMELIALNEDLRAKLSQIPLAPKPKKADDSVIKAKSPAQVRELTERQWGQKPGENDVN